MSDSHTYRRIATKAEVAETPFPLNAGYEPVLRADQSPEAFSGGMGVVFRARDVHLDRDVAIKRMRPDLLEDATSQQRFLQEARAQARLRHNNIVAVHAAREDAYGPWVVLEWVDGQSLHDLYDDESGPRPPMDDIISWVLQITDALIYVHQMDFIHRDVKPGNILLRSSDRRPLLTDFGLVADRRRSRIRSGVSVSGVSMGTWDFIAPEQDRDASKVTALADQWSLGATLGWLITGMTMRTLRERDLPVNLREVVFKATERHPQDRFRDLGEFRDALKSVADRPTAQLVAARSAGSASSGSTAGVPDAASAPSTASPQPMARPAQGPKVGDRPAGEDLADLVQQLLAKVAEHHALARELRDQQHYADAVAALEQIPEAQRHLLDATLYQECVRQRDQVQSLDREISTAVKALRFDGVREKIVALQQLQPWREDLGRLLKSLPAAPAAPAKPQLPKSLTAPFDAHTAKASQLWLAKFWNLPEEWSNSVGMKFRPIPAGTFLMGSASGQGSDDERPQHSVTLTQPFWLGVHQVTQGQWQQVMGTTPWKGQRYVIEGADVAVTWVSWEDVVAFCEQLSKKEGKRYRLPTEAEWEWSCRAGTTTEYSFGDDENALGEYAWYNGNASSKNEKHAHRVGQKRANPFGLYDVHGNVYEWCSDLYDAGYYQQSPSENPQGPGFGSSRVLRGGSWCREPISLRSSNRSNGAPGYRDGNIGCRVLLEGP